MKRKIVVVTAFFLSVATGRAALCADGPAANSTSSPATWPSGPSWTAGFRVFKWSCQAGDGTRRPLVTAVWYPSSVAEGVQHAYASRITGKAVQDAPVAKAPNASGFPLIVFSHGFGGGAIQSTYLTEYLASRGYVVAAPDHNDPVAALRITGPTGVDMDKYLSAAGELVRSGKDMPRDKYAYRPEELRAVIDRMLAESASKDSPLHGAIDAGRIGCCGHSMGGYTCLAVIGCWEKYTDGRIKAAVLHSPGVFMWNDEEYKPVGVPTMYMYGQYEGWNHADKLPGTDRAYRNTPPPKWLIEIRQGRHLTFGGSSWQRMIAASQPAAAVAAQHQTIARYTLAVFQRYLRGDAEAEKVLSSGDAWTSRFEADIGRKAPRE